MIFKKLKLLLMLGLSVLAVVMMFETMLSSSIDSRSSAWVPRSPRANGIYVIRTAADKNASSNDDPNPSQGRNDQPSLQQAAVSNTSINGQILRRLKDSISAHNAHSNTSTTSTSSAGVITSPSDVDKMLRDSAKFPRVLIIGFAKTGTKALYEALKLHPQLSGPLKELRYFTEHYNEGQSACTAAGIVQKYLDRFDWPPEGGFNIEKSPDYILSSKAAIRLKHASLTAGIDPSMLRFVVVLRNPIARSVSDFLELKSWNLLHNTAFSKNFVDHVIDSRGQIQTNSKIVNASCYSYHIDKWRKHFPNSQFCYVNGDVFTADPYTETKSLEACLKLKPFFEPSNFVYNKQRGFYCFIGSNQPTTTTTSIRPICMSKSKGRKHPVIEDVAFSKLKEFYSPWNQKLYNLINRTDLDWETSNVY